VAIVKYKDATKDFIGTYVILLFCGKILLQFYHRGHKVLHRVHKGFFTDFEYLLVGVLYGEIFVLKSSIKNKMYKSATQLKLNRYSAAGSQKIILHYQPYRQMLLDLAKHHQQFLLVQFLKDR